MVLLPLCGTHGSERGLALQGAVCNASCREQAAFGRLDLHLFVLRKHFLLTLMRKEPVLWHAASACQLHLRMVVEKKVEVEISAHRVDRQMRRNCPVHPTQESHPLTFVSYYCPL